jgi:hypothetical protein
LTVTPLTLWIATGLRDATAQRRLQLGLLANAWHDERWRGTEILLAIVAALVAIGYLGGGTTHMLALTGLFATLTTAAWCCGWQSTAIVGAAANLGVVALMPTHDDLLTIQMQCAIAVVMSGLLLFGARTTVSRKLAQSLQRAEQNIAALRERARQDLYAAEQHRLVYAHKLSIMHRCTHEEAMRLRLAADLALPLGTLDRYEQQLDQQHQHHRRIAAGLSPPVFFMLGGRDGPIVQTLLNLGILAEIRCVSPLPSLERLSKALSLAMYRLSCEAAAYLVKHAPTDCLRIVITVHEQEGQRPAVEIVLDSFGVRVAMLRSDAYSIFRFGVGATGLDEQALDQHAQLYDGYAKVARIDFPGHPYTRVHLRLIDLAESIHVAPD